MPHREFINGILARMPDGRAPAGWSIRLVDEVAKRGSGHTPAKNHPEYWSGTIKWLSLRDLHRLDKVYVTDTTACISVSGIANSSAVVHPAGVVILSRDAGVGKSAVAGCEMAVSQHFLVWECGPEVLNLYLYYWFQFVKPEFERVAVGSTIKTIGLPYFRKQLVILPTVAEQQVITEALLRWDRLAVSLSRLLRQKRRFKRGLMQQLLTGKRRFKEFVDGRAPASGAAGALSASWEVRPLRDVFEPIRRKNTEGVDLVLTASGEHGLVDQREFFDRSVAGSDLTGYYLLKRGEFAYNRSSMNGYPFGAIKRLDDHPAGAVSTLYVCFGLKSRFRRWSDYFTELFESGFLDRQLRQIVGVGGRAHGLLNVSKGDFFRLEVPVPPREEQAAIAGLLGSVQREIDLLTRLREAMDRQRRGVMELLLTGKVRVPE
jgi:type I restriction enzyme, S subunit